MSQRIFWINAGMFLLLPLSIGFMLLISQPEPPKPAQLQSNTEGEKQTINNDLDRQAPDISLSDSGLKSIILSPGALKSPNQQNSFDIDIELTGGIGYFNGGTNLQGQTFPADPHRFLAQEEIRVDMYFSAEPREITVSINDFERRLAGIPGRRYYWTSFILPEWPSTLDRAGNRLAAPYQLQVTAISRANPEIISTITIDDIEITGNVMSIVHVQPK